MVLAAAACGSFGAGAQSYPQIELGKTYTMTYTPTVYEFVAPSDGTLTIATNSYSPYASHSGATLLFTGPEHTFEQGMPILGRIDNRRGYSYLYAVEADTPYYFFVEINVLEPSPTFTFTMDSGALKPAVTGCYPEPNVNSAYNLASYPELQLLFNYRGVEFESASLVFQSASGEASTSLDYREIITEQGPRIDFLVKSAIDEVKARILDKSVFTVLLVKPNVNGEPVTGPYVDADGNISLSYYYEAQTSAVSSTFPSVFLSYWAQGNPEGRIVVVFDGPLLPLDGYADLEVVPTVSLIAGTYTDGEDGRKLLPGAPIVIDGNTLSIDLCGVQRETDQKVVSIDIQNILDINGMSIDYYGSGAIQRWDIPYEKLSKIDLEYEFTPSSGSLQDVAAVELWVSGFSLRHVGIDGFRYEVAGESEPIVLSLDDVTVENDPLDPSSMLYYIPVPELVKAAPGATLSAVLSSFDGFEYEMSATFGDTGIDKVSASDGSNVIFTTGGLRVNSPADSLPAGIYIVNGRKMVITK